MTNCLAYNPHGHGQGGHYCIGELGHEGRHWCLLGHIWFDDDEEEDS